MVEYHPRHVKSAEYYKKLLLAIAEGFQDELSYSELAGRLNEGDIRTPSGDGWSASKVKNIVYDLRHQRSYLYDAMLRLHFDGVIGKADVLPILRK